MEVQFVLHAVVVDLFADLAVEYPDARPAPAVRVAELGEEHPREDEPLGLEQQVVALGREVARDMFRMAVVVFEKMQEEIGDIWADVAKGDLSKVTDWLRSHIHRYASFKKPGELFESVCGKFDAKYYTDYLTEKYTKLYGL